MPLETTTLSWLVIVALALSAIALLLSLVALRRGGRRSARATARTPRPQPVRRPRKGAPVAPEEVVDQVESLRADVATSLRHLAVVRYDAFGDMGGHLSWSMALLDDSGDGVVLTSIHGRSDSRTYAKNITGWTANQQLSPEEEEAIGFARSAS